MYSGDLKNDDTVLGWITKELRETGIREVNAEVLHSILERTDYVAVVYYDKNKKADLVRNFRHRRLACPLVEYMSLNTVYFKPINFGLPLVYPIRDQTI